MFEERVCFSCTFQLVLLHFLSTPDVKKQLKEMFGTMQVTLQTDALRTCFAYVLRILVHFLFFHL